MKGLHTPWSDEITLLRFSGEKNAAGYRNPETVASDPPLFCSFEDGVSQSEFYLSRKAGMQADAQAEVWRPTMTLSGRRATPAGGRRCCAGGLMRSCGPSRTAWTPRS